MGFQINLDSQDSGSPIPILRVRGIILRMITIDDDLNENQVILF